MNPWKSAQISDTKKIVRQELKFPCISTLNFCSVLDVWGMKPSFPDRKVFSIYFDSTNFDLFRVSEEGLTPRRKIRLRWYDEPRNICNSILEIKTTTERGRIKEKFNIESTDSRYLQEYIQLLTTLYLAPICQVQYHRAYFESRDGARATVDTRICYTRVTDQFKVLGKGVVDPFNVLELKTENLALSEKLTGKNHLPMERFSKYCRSIEESFGLQI